MWGKSGSETLAVFMSVVTVRDHRESRTNRLCVALTLRINRRRDADAVAAALFSGVERAIGGT